MALVPQGMQQSKSDGLGMFSLTNEMMKQIQGTHAPDGREVDVKPLLDIIEDILHHVPIISGIVQTTHEAQLDAIQDEAIQSSFPNKLDILATISKISCEIACKCSGAGDAHATTLGLLNTLSCYSWDAKVVIGLAAFAVNYGEFCLVAQLYPSNPLAKSVAILKQLPDMLERADTLKPKFEALIKAMMDVTKCIVAFKELPSQYITPDTPEMVTATAHISTAAYWLIRSIVACASQIMGLIDMGHDYVTPTTEPGELSSLADEVNNIYIYLKNCYQDYKKHIEAYQDLVRLFDKPENDNLKILKALIYAKEDQLLSFGSESRVPIDSLRGKNVLLFISDLDLPHEVLSTLKQMYQESQQQPTTVERDYEVVWLPVVAPWNENKQKQFETLGRNMPWYSVSDPSLLDPAVIRYIKNVWRFNKKPLLVVLDPQGKVENPNAIPMMLKGRKLAFPFTSSRVDALWMEGKWNTIDLLACTFYPELYDWNLEEKYICLYGGDDSEWEEFKSALQKFASAAKIPLEMLYVGKRNPRVKVEKKNATILDEKLSHTPQDSAKQMGLFWNRLESMWHYKVQHGKSVENDTIMQEIMIMLSFDGSDQGWAVIYRGSAEMVAKAKGKTILRCLNEYESWKELVRQKGFMYALNYHLSKLPTPHHCNHLRLPWTNGIFPEKVVCPDCNRPMEKFILYRCCTD